MITNDDKGQILENIQSKVLNSSIQINQHPQQLFQQLKENHNELKKLVRGQRSKNSDYHQETVQEFQILNKINNNNPLLSNYERNNQQSEKISAKQLNRLKENLPQNQHSNNICQTNKSNSPELFNQEYDYSRNINIEQIKNIEDQRIQNIREYLQTQIQINLNNKLKQYVDNNIDFIQSRVLPKQKAQLNHNNNILCQNSCTNIQKYFYLKSQEFKHKFFEQLSQMPENKNSIIQQKNNSLQSLNKQISRSFELSKQTPQKRIINYDLDSTSILRINNGQYFNNLVKSSNLNQDLVYSIFDCNEKNQTPIKTESNQYSIRNDKSDQQNFNKLKEEKSQENSKINLENLGCIHQTQNQLTDSPGSPIFQSSKVNRYKKLIQSFKAFQVNQTQLKSEIKIKNSIQVNDLNHISEFSIFKPEKQNNSYDEGFYSQRNKQSICQTSQTNKEFDFESVNYQQQNNNCNLNILKLNQYSKTYKLQEKDNDLVNNYKLGTIEDNQQSLK